jgi:hypothetical protein
MIFNTEMITISSVCSLESSRTNDIACVRPEVTQTVALEEAIREQKSTNMNYPISMKPKSRIWVTWGAMGVSVTRRVR